MYQSNVKKYLNITIFLVLSIVSTVSFADEQKSKRKAETDLFHAPEIEFSKPDPVLGFIGARDFQSLNGDWQIIVDPMGAGTPGGFMDYTSGIRNDDGMTLVEYDFETSDKVQVPGDFNTQDERLFFYQGWVWYYKKITKPEILTDEKLHLWFGGVNFSSEIFINGQAVGKHVGGYVPFSFDVTDSLRVGENELIVRVNSSLDTESVPTFRTDWWPYGGLIRDVALVKTPKHFIRNAKVQLVKGSYDTISVDVSAQGLKNTPVNISIPELDINVAGQINDKGNASFTFKASPELWSPENPKLYQVEIAAGNDTLQDQIGFRQIETRGKQIFLNDQAIKFKGISTHEEPIGEQGVAYSEKQIVKVLEEAKHLGVNFVRAAHYPYSRHLAKAADKLGVMLWEEIPVYWNISWENPETLAIARDQMQRLVQRDWNRSSVVVWSVANETPYSEPRMNFLENLITLTRDLDNTRLVSGALIGNMDAFDAVALHAAAKGAVDDDFSVDTQNKFKTYLAKQKGHIPSATDHYHHIIDDPLGELSDIVSYNQYFGWYYSAMLHKKIGVTQGEMRQVMFKHMADMSISSVYEKPIQISEFGAGAKAGNKGGESLLWTEEYQAMVYRAQTNMLANSPQVQGMTPWILKDFRAMLRPLSGIQDYYNRKGLIAPDGQRKQAYYILQNFYKNDW
jgi:beta-glucuronidase